MDKSRNSCRNTNFNLITILLKALLFCNLTGNCGVRAMDILYPFYVYPGTPWIDFINVIRNKSRVTFHIIVNIDNGPGKTVNALYLNGLGKFSNLPNVRFYGYINSNNGDCFNWAKASAACVKGKAIKVSDVYVQMANWVKWYGPKCKLKGFYLDKFLPYNGAASKSAFSLSSVLRDYGDIYKYMKKTYPSFTLIGNPTLLSKDFSSANVKVADIMAVEQAARNFLADPSDNTKASFAYFPPGYGKAFIAKQVVVPPADAAKQLTSLLSLAKKYGAQYFVAVRDYSTYPADLLPAQVRAL